MQAMIFEEAADLGTSRSYMATAIKRLDDRDTNQRGGAQQTPNIRPNGRGIKSIRTFR